MFHFHTCCFLPRGKLREYSIPGSVILLGLLCLRRSGKSGSGTWRRINYLFISSPPYSTMNVNVLCGGLCPGKAARYPSGPRYRGLSWFSKAIPDVRVCPISAKILGRQNAHMYISKKVKFGKCLSLFNCLICSKLRHRKKNVLFSSFKYLVV